MPAPSRTIPPKGVTPVPNMSDEQYQRYGMDNLPGPNPLAPDDNPGNESGDDADVRAS